MIRLGDKAALKPSGCFAGIDRFADHRNPSPTEPLIVFGQPASHQPSVGQVKYLVSYRVQHVSLNRARTVSRPNLLTSRCSTRARLPCQPAARDTCTQASHSLIRKNNKYSQATSVSPRSRSIGFFFPRTFLYNVASDRAQLQLGKRERTDLTIHRHTKTAHLLNFFHRYQDFYTKHSLH